MSDANHPSTGYLVIARKYRPQLFEEIAGQDATAQTLRNAILQHRIGHAYLFAGVRGVGKTTTARILAKALNCVQGPTVTPCNECDSCKEIAAGNAIDVMEIDAASNRGIDEIRELRENVKYRPSRDRYKVFIIDEVHMLTTEAFNALLKTLEEPPEHVVFILATTEIHKVPATILSRCQQFNFKAIDRPTILARLKEIASQENLAISDASLNDIISAAEGSMRDAQSLLDQVISFCGKSVDPAQVRDMLGIIPQQWLDDMTCAVADADARRVVELVDQLVSSGRNLQQFLRDLLAHFRNLMLIKIAGTGTDLVVMSAEELSRSKELAARFSEEDLLRFFGILVSTESELRWSSQARFHLEMGLLKLVHTKRLVPLEQLLAGLQGIGGESVPATAENARPNNPQAAAPSPARTMLRNAAPAAAAPQGLAANLKAEVGKVSPMLASMLDHASDIQAGESGLQIRFAAQHQFYCDMVQSPENLEVIRKVAATLLGGTRPVKVVLDSAAQAVEEPPAAPSEGAAKAELIERVKNEPGVKTVLETFQGEIVDVKELNGGE